MAFATTCNNKSDCENAPTLWRISGHPDVKYIEFYIDSEKQIYYDDNWYSADLYLDSAVRDNSKFSEFLIIKPTYFTCCKLDEYEDVFVQMMLALGILKQQDLSVVKIEPIDTAFYNHIDKNEFLTDYLDSAYKREKLFFDLDFFTREYDSSHYINITDTIIPIRRQE